MPYKPDMKLVNKWASKYNIKEPIKESELPDKKLKVLHNNKWIHFGHTKYEDFTIHRDVYRQKNYCKRAGGIKDKRGRITGNDPASANYYAMRLLWDCKPMTTSFM